MSLTIKPEVGELRYCNLSIIAPGGVPPYCKIPFYNPAYIMYNDKGKRDKEYVETNGNGDIILLILDRRINEYYGTEEYKCLAHDKVLWMRFDFIGRKCV